MEENFKHLSVTFYLDKKLNKNATEEKKRPVYDDVEKVRIRAAGDSKTDFHAPAHSQSSSYDKHSGHRMTYAELHHGPYEAFKKGLEAAVQGTPIEVLPGLTPGKVAELQGANIVTIEQLAQLDGTMLDKLGMGGRDLKNQSIQFLDDEENAASNSELSAENSELKERLAALEAQMAEKGQVTTAPDKNEGPTEPNPFSDMDLDTVKLWMEDQGGKFDTRWSLSTAQTKAQELNEKLSNEKE